ncbi:MAG: substrate-binding domain-containing protein [Acidobacteria bacterium]|nr:substrate-binding domain-containing protein [Acidobacteriota bacterium]
MQRFLTVTLLLALAPSLTASGPPASNSQAAGDGNSAAEVAVVTSGGLAAAYDALAPRFEARTDLRLVTAYGASGGGATDSIPARLERGERFDLLIMSQAGLNALAEQGLIRPDTRVDLASSSIGMAVLEGAPLPDISTPEAFVATLLAAESIGYSASVSGTYVSTELFPRLGLDEQLAPKSRRIVSERVAAVVARGEVEIGFQQVSEILSIEGAAYAGPIPDEYQRVTTFSAGIATDAENPAGAQRLIDFLLSDDAAATIAETGLEPVASVD